VPLLRPLKLGLSGPVQRRSLLALLAYTLVVPLLLLRLPRILVLLHVAGALFAMLCCCSLVRMRGVVAVASLVQGAVLPSCAAVERTGGSMRHVLTPAPASAVAAVLQRLRCTARLRRRLVDGCLCMHLPRKSRKIRAEA
jgi:hypothetical protein